MGCLTLLLLIGLALVGGTGTFATFDSAELIPTPSELATFAVNDTATPEQLSDAVRIIETRLSMLGIEPDVRLNTTGVPQIAVLLPGGGDLPETLAFISQPGYLEFIDLSDVDGANYADATLWTTGQAARFGDAVPGGAEINGVTNAPFETVIDGTMVTEAVPTLDSMGNWTVQIQIDADGAAILSDFTAAHTGEPMAITIDGKVIVAPIIQMAISDQVVIAGNFTEPQARRLAAQIMSGLLPVSMELISLS